MFNFKTKKPEPVAVIEAAPVPAMPRKYELLPLEKVTGYDGSSLILHRIKALVDIPEHGVKAGDLGGYVSSEKVLSHKGSCWVGGNAVAMAVYGKDFSVINDALVTDNAFTSSVIYENAKVSGNAVIEVSVFGNSDISGDCRISNAALSGTIVTRGKVNIINAKVHAGVGSSIVLDGNISIESDHRDENLIFVREGEKLEIKGNVNLSNVSIRGNCKIDAEVNLESVTFRGDTTILGKPQIKPDVKFTGKNLISGDALIPPGTHVHDVSISSGVLNYGGISPSLGSSATVPAPSTVSAPVGFSASVSETQECIDLIGQIEAEYEAYTTDIVKLIKYPAMVDTSVPEVGEFVYNLRAAKRAVKVGNADKIIAIAETLERAFLKAENKVQTLVASHLDENKKKSLKDAEKMFKLACDEASPEPEKRLGFKAGMRALEGIVVVSDKATENLKAKIGILELEA